MDKPGTPESSAASSEFREKPDNRTPAQIERDNADKQAAWEGRRASAAERFNSYTKDKNMEGVIKTRRTAREVQADIDNAYDRGADDSYIAGLQEELRQAKILDGITSRIENVRAKNDPSKPTDVGTEDDGQAVSTKGRQGRRADPHRDMKAEVRRMAEAARDSQAKPAPTATSRPDPNAALQEAANIDNPDHPDYIPPVNAMGEPDGGLSGPPEPAPRRTPSAAAADDVTPEDLALEASATEITPDPVPTPDAPATPETPATPDEPEVPRAPDEADAPKAPEETTPDPSTKVDEVVVEDAKPKSKPKQPVSWGTRAGQVASLAVPTIGAGLALRAMFGSGGGAGLAQPIGGAVNAFPPEGGSDAGDAGDAFVTSSPYPSDSSFTPMSSADRIKLMQQMNSWQPNSGTQTAQSWRY
jgi:hypothetical protein